MASSNHEMRFDLERFARLKAQQKAAKAKGLEDFTFDGHALLTSYAGYLVEFLTGRFEVEVVDLTCQACGAAGCGQCGGRGHNAD